MNAIRIKRYLSPVGELLVGSFDGKLCICDWAHEKRRDINDRRIRHALHAVYEDGASDTIERAIAQLDEYFDHKRTFLDIPLLFAGTDFQKKVWNELLEIPYGATASYAGLSQRLSNPKAVRAVAAANGANALSIFVPCHRIIGSNRQLTGYAGGLPAKKLLLELESPAGLFG